MALITALDLAKSYGPLDIFRNVSLSLPHAARIAIVGPNGIGKTTLLRILLGLEEPSAGALQRARGLTMGYLAQEAVLDSTHSLWDECLAALEGLRQMETELAQLEHQMSDPSQADQALERYGRLQAEFERRGGYLYETRIRQTLTGLGFEADDYRRPVYQLSGGQRTRAVLARLLLSDPDLLILDEPTNHLDIQAVEWLEGYLSQWSGSVLIVSHDRYFLDRVVDHIWEMSPQGIEAYRGNYTAYLQQRQERWDLRLQVYESEMARLFKDLEYIKKNISGQNVQQAKGRLKRLSREVQAIEALGFDALSGQNWAQISEQVSISTSPFGVDEAEKRIRALRPPVKRIPQLNLHLHAGHRSGDLVLRTHDLAVGYADEGRPLFRTPDLLLKRGECAAVIGPNGAGKTTFLKTILAQMPPLEGEVTLGASLKIGYFAQAHEGLDPQRTLAQEIESVAPGMLSGAVRDYLAKFLFTGEDVFKRVGTLSGGERGRLALAKLSLEQANLLLLDEPTNHLDIPSQEILQEVLDAFQGTILLVSHDRYLIDALGTQIWEIIPGEALLQVFEGDYTRYRAAQERAREEAAAARALSAREAAATDARAPTGRPFDSRRGRPSLTPDEKKRQKRLKEVEAEIIRLEGELADLSRRLENPPADIGLVHKLGKEYAAAQEALDLLMEEWAGLES
ncbi:MAG: ribosomal protection-like ABC-F family protein [Chloroflexota bacterium]